MRLVDILYGLETEMYGARKARVLNALYFGGEGYFVSIQASSAHYSTPRKTVPLEDYTHFEVLVELPYEDVPDSWRLNYDDGSGSLFCFVPKEDVENLVNTLIVKYGIRY